MEMRTLFHGYIQRNCKQCKMDVTISDEFRGEMFKNSEDLRKMCIVTCDSHEDEDCNIVKLIYPDNDNAVCFISTRQIIM